MVTLVAVVWPGVADVPCMVPCSLFDPLYTFDFSLLPSYFWGIIPDEAMMRIDPDGQGFSTRAHVGLECRVDTP